MTPQEAIEAIRLKDIHIESGAIRITAFFQGLSVAKEALEKQIPKKPIQTSQPCFYWCPHCGSAIKKRIEHSVRIIENCPFCGQVLDWSDIK